MKNKFLTMTCFAMLVLFMVGCPDSTTDKPTQNGKTAFYEEEGGGESYFSFDDTIDDLNWGTLIDMTPSGDKVEEPATPPIITGPQPVVEDTDTVVEHSDPVVEEIVPVEDETAPAVEIPVIEGTEMSITKAEFGEMPDGKKVDIFTLTNANGASMKVLSLGGIIYELNVPDKDGNFGNVSANVETVEDYLTKSPNFGTLVGRYGNRIAAGKYTIDGVEYDHGTGGSPLLHGGRNGFHKVIWDIEELKGDDFVGLTLKLTSDEAHQGFPGTVECVVTYKFNNKNEWEIDYTATTDTPTPINLTQHTYFNLSAFHNATILDEIMMLNADEFIPVDAALIPTGEIASVEGTAMDFRTPTPIGERIDQVGDNPKGYDHCWVLNKGETPDSMTLCAKAVDPTSGRAMEVWTTEPGVQFYTGNFLNGSFGSANVTYVKNSAYCLETQHYPDSPNQSHFPNTILRPGETYRTTTVYKFGVQE